MQRYSNLFGKTVRDVKKDIKLTSHRHLYQAGFIRESTTGRYYYLPLGMRVRDKIVKIVEEEMNKTGAQKMIIPIMQPLEVWKETNRDKSGGYELTIVKDQNQAEFTLGGTGEEMFTHIVRMIKLSYRDLPLNIYQFGNKFRDEKRPRGGLLRLREFLMKDAYSFDVDEEHFKIEYQKMWDVYLKSFERMGLNAHPVLADNGYYGGDYAHEFIVESDAGESTYFVSEDGKYIAHEDVATFKRDEVNSDEDLKDFEIIDQPDWVRTMEDNEKHYGLPASRFLKNVVYKNRATGEIIIGSIRGDLEVNKNKLEKVLNMMGLLDDATDDDLASIGTKSGYVHSWGHNATYVGDLSLKTVKNFIGGQKEEKTDSINVNYGRDFEHPITADIALAKAGFTTEDGSSKLIEKKGIEVGNLFNLGYYYSNKMKEAMYTDSDGTQKPYYMGSYGIGIDRSLGTVVEIHSDDKGIIWPESIAPYDIHFITIGEQHNEKALELIKSLEESGKEVLWDDRSNVNPGAKFADADLIGIPLRVVLSDRSIQNGGAEVKRRDSTESKIIDLNTLIKEI
jgi:prolyl-tRNA synthetase